MNMSIKKLFMTKKVVVVGAAVALTLGLSGAAYAYFGSTGSGSGIATVASSSTIQLSSNTVGPLSPGGGSTWVQVNVTNPGPANEYVGTITPVVADQDASNGNTCYGSWFTVTPIAYDHVVLAGATIQTGEAVQMNESNTDQSACEGLSMTINWTSN